MVSITSLSYTLVALTTMLTNIYAAPTLEARAIGNCYSIRNAAGSYLVTGTGNSLKFAAGANQAAVFFINSIDGTIQLGRVSNNIFLSSSPTAGVGYSSNLDETLRLKFDTTKRQFSDGKNFWGTYSCSTQGFLYLQYKLGCSVVDPLTAIRTACPTA